MDDSIERRNHPRKNVKWPVTLLTESDMVEGETRDISIAGISICIDKPVCLDEIIRISIRPTGHQVIEVSGKVTWSDLYGIDDQNRAVAMGVSFVEISDQDRHFLHKVISPLTGD